MDKVEMSLDEIIRQSKNNKPRQNNRAHDNKRGGSTTSQPPRKGGAVRSTGSRKTSRRGSGTNYGGITRKHSMGGFDRTYKYRGEAFLDVNKSRYREGQHAMSETYFMRTPYPIGGYRYGATSGTNCEGGRHARKYGADADISIHTKAAWNKAARSKAEGRKRMREKIPTAKELDAELDQYMMSVVPKSDSA